MNPATQLSLPADIRERVFDVLTQAQAPQWIETDRKLKVRRTLGTPLVSQASRGSDLADVLPCLVGATDIAPITFPVVNLEGGVIVDVHLFQAGEGFEVLLVDATARHAETRETQQQAQEIALLNRRLEKLTVALDLARTEALSASETKSQFIAGMSHEFRTPLTSVLGFADLMRSGVADEGQGLAGIRESAMYLLSLVDNLLEHGASGPGNTAINPESVEPQQFFDGVFRQLQPLADRQALLLRFEGPESSPEMMIVDPVRCRQILINLLTNALRHTTVGHVTLRWRLAQRQLDVDVIDTGSGIAGQDLERIFMPFERGKEVSGRPGAGLGLAISRQLAEAMGGTLTVVSQWGSGSTFSLSLPLKTPASGRFAGPSDGGASRPKVRIVVVDDDPNICAVLRLALTDAGHQVLTCRSELELLNTLNPAAPPQVALVDLDLYGNDGLEVVAGLKQRFPQLAVFAMSAASSPKLVERVRAAGCLGFVAKPFELNELTCLIEQTAANPASPS